MADRTQASNEDTTAKAEEQWPVVDEQNGKAAKCRKMSAEDQCHSAAKLRGQAEKDPQTRRTPEANSTTGKGPKAAGRAARHGWQMRTRPNAERLARSQNGKTNTAWMQRARKSQPQCNTH